MLIMKLRLEYDNWDYGTVGEYVQLEGLKLKVGDVYSIRHYDTSNSYHTTQCMVVNKQDENSNNRHPFFMGLGVGGLGYGERVEALVSKYQMLKVGDNYKSLVVTEV